MKRGADKLARYAKHPRSVRTWCSTCGGHVFTEHPEWGLVDVFAALIDDFEFVPGVHANYQETVLGIHDGLPSSATFPRHWAVAARPWPNSPVPGWQNGTA